MMVTVLAPLTLAPDSLSSLSNSGIDPVYFKVPLRRGGQDRCPEPIAETSGSAPGSPVTPTICVTSKALCRKESQVCGARYSLRVRLTLAVPTASGTSVCLLIKWAETETGWDWQQTVTVDMNLEHCTARRGSPSAAITGSPQVQSRGQGGQLPSPLLKVGFRDPQTPILHVRAWAFVCLYIFLRQGFSV